MINPLAPTPKKDDVDLHMKSIDYLRELRIKRDQDEHDGIVRPRKGEMASFDRCINDPNMSDFQKLEAVRRKAELIEAKAR